MQLAEQRDQSVGYHFEVGYTHPMKYDLNKLAERRPPRNLLDAIHTQANNFDPERWMRPPAATEVNKQDECVADAPEWDWRRVGNITRIRDQADCGACSGFATAAAIETNFSSETRPSPIAILMFQSNIL